MLLRLVLISSICCLLLLAVPRPLVLAQDCNSFSIKAAPNFPIGAKPYGLATSDFDHDGNVDVAIGSAEIQSVSILGGYGTGSLKPAVKSLAGSGPRSLRTADFNNDTNPDLAFVSDSSTIVILIGSGDGSFSVGATLSAGLNNFNLISSGDFNGDGITDLVATSLFDPHEIYFFLGGGDGRFGSAISIARSSVTLAITVGDFNGDGKSDVVFLFPSSGPNNAGIIFGTAGAFAPPALFDAGDSPGYVVSGDFDNDNKRDLAITDSGGSGFISILSGTGAGSFALTKSFDSKIGALAIGDFNTDGRLDLAGFNDSRNTLGVWFNSSSGTFIPSAEFFAGGTVRYLEVADLNNDSRSDLAVANVDSQDVSILLNDGGQGFLASESIYTGSGSPNTPGAGSPSDVISEDLNSDGRPDIISVDYLLARAAVLMGNANGTLNPAVYYRLEHEAIPSIGYPGAQAGFVTGVVALDYNRDGKLDLVSSNLGTHNFSVIFGDGTGAFGLPFNFNGTFSALTMKRGDLNGDSIPDLVVAGSPDNGFGVGVMLGRQQGGFNPIGTTYGVGQYPKLQVADVTNDGKPDIICTAINLDRITILVGDGLGGVSTTNIITLNVHPSTVTPADLNGDGHQDLVLLAYDPGKLMIFLNAPNGLTLVNTYPVPVFAGITTVSDFTADGLMDIALASGNPRVVKFYAGSGSGGFELLGTFGSGGDPRSSVEADLNQDGRPELMVANYASSTLTVLFSKPCVVPDLSLKKSHSQSFVIGQNGTYTLQVSNTGLENSVGQIKIVDNLPTGLSFVSAAGSSWLCSSIGQSVSCDYSGRLFPGVTASLAVTVAVGAVAFPSVINTASLTPSDSNAANNTANDPTQIAGGLTISGTVLNSSSGVSAVTLTISGDQSASTVTSANGTYAFNVPNGSYIVTPSRNGYLFSPNSVSLPNVTSNQVVNFDAIPQPPSLFTEENSSTAIALESPTFRMGPFPVTQMNYFGFDNHTRVIIFAATLAVASGEDINNVTVQAEDSQHRIYSLPLEAVSQFPGFDWISQITVRLTDELNGVGDLQVSISLHGLTSNKAMLPLRVAAAPQSATATRELPPKRVSSKPFSGLRLKF